jgi:hypothetical protein
MSVDFATLVVKADSSQLAKTRDDLGRFVNGSKEAEKGAESVAAATDKASASFKNFALGIGAVAVAYKALNFGKESIALYETQMLAEAKLEQVVRATGMAAGFTADELKKMSVEMQSVTRFGDETILSAQAMLLTFKNISGEVFTRSLKALGDMGEMFGGMEAASVQLGKALNDPIQGVSALSRVGIQFTDSQKKMIEDFVKVNDIASAQNIILKELEGQFGGVAEAMANTPVGRLQQQKNILSDIREEIGEKIIPAQLEWNKGMMSLVSFGLKALEAYQNYATIAGAIIGGTSIKDAIEDVRTARTVSLAATMEKEKALSYLFDVRLDVLKEIEQKENQIGIMKQRQVNLTLSGNAKLAEKEAQAIERERAALFNIKDRAETLRRAMVGYTQADPQRPSNPLAPTPNPANDEAAKAAASEYNKLLQERERILNSLMSTEDKFEQSFNRIHELFNQQILSPDEYERAFASIAEQYDAYRQGEIEKLYSGLLTEEQMIEQSYERRRQMILESDMISDEQRRELEILNNQDRERRYEAMLRNRERATVSYTSNELGMFGDMFASIGGMMRSSGKEQSAVYKAMFNVSKGFALAQSLVSIGVGLAKSAEVGWPQNLVTMAGHIATTAGIIGSISAANYSGAYDNGGRIPAGMWGIAGERGPEIIQGPANVTSRKDTASILNNSGAPTTINLYDQSGSLVNTFHDQLRSRQMDTVVDEIAQRMKERAV